MRHERPSALVRLRDEAAGLSARLAGGVPETLLEETVAATFAGRIALVSSFGAASVVLLHMVARIDPATPVLFLETGKHFPETLAYRDGLVARLGLSDVRTLRPDPAAVAGVDPSGDLAKIDSVACCRLRKVDPLEAGLAPFEAWITGRRAGQTANRAGLPLAEVDGAGRIKLNPLARWGTAEVAGYLARHGLPEHPLVARGYPSIGCAPCTTPVAPGEDERAGRWRGSGRDECGIHLAGGRLVRAPAPRRAAPMDLV